LWRGRSLRKRARDPPVDNEEDDMLRDDELEDDDQGNVGNENGNDDDDVDVNQQRRLPGQLDAVDWLWCY
jgi:hypothetical protein